MSGYLEQLASRALNLAPVLQPRLPAWFEPVATPTPALQEVVIEQEAPANLEPPLRPAQLPVDTRRVVVTQPAPVLQAAPVQRTSNIEAAPQSSAPLSAIAAVRIEREIRERHEVLVERRIEAQSTLVPIVSESASRPSQASNGPAQAPQAMPTGNRTSPAAHSAVVPAAVHSPAALEPVPIEARAVANLAPPARMQTHPAPWPAAVDPSVMAGLVPKPVSLAPTSPAASPVPRHNPLQPTPAVSGVLPKQAPMLVPTLRPEAALRPTQPTPPRPIEPPVIEISIGRVDVRAVSTPPPSSTPRVRSVAPLLSLDDYLRHKDGGTQ